MDVGAEVGRRDQRVRRRVCRVAVVVSSIVMLAAVSGCGLAAAPCRVASAGLKILPVVGHVAAAPTDACAAVIDP